MLARSVLLLASMLWSVASPADTAEALVVANDFREALAAGDGERASGLLAENVVVYEQGGVERSRAEYQAHHLAADMTFLANVEVEVLAQQVIEGTSVVVVISEIRQLGTYRGEPVDRVTTETLVLTEADGAWRIRHVHWSG